MNLSVPFHLQGEISWFSSSSPLKQILQAGSSGISSSVTKNPSGRSISESDSHLFILISELDEPFPIESSVTLSLALPNFKISPLF